MLNFFLTYPHIVFSLLSFISAFYLCILLLFKFRSRGGLSFALLSFSMGIWQLGKFIQNITLIENSTITVNLEFWHRISFIGATFIYATFYRFACRISFRDRGLTKQLSWLGYFSAIIFCILDMMELLSVGDRITQYGYYRDPNTLYILYTVTYFAFMGLGLFVLFPNFYKKVPQIKKQTSAIFYSAQLGFGIGTLEFAGIFWEPLYPVSNLAPAVFAVVIYWAIYRYNLIVASDVVKSTLLWGLYLGLVLALTFSIYHISNGLAAVLHIPISSTMQIILYAVFIILLTPLYLFILKSVRKRFFPVRYSYKLTYSALSAKLSQTGSLEEMYQAVIDIMEKEFGYRRGTGVIFEYSGSDFIPGNYTTTGRSLPERLRPGIFSTHKVTKIVSRRKVIADLRLSIQSTSHFSHLMDLRMLNRLGRDLLMPIYHQEKVSGLLIFKHNKFRPESWGTVSLILNSLTDILSNYTSQVILLKARSDAEHFSRIGMMAATMAHEIKNPLGGIYGAAQILKENSPANEKFINIILKDAARLNDVIKRFLEFSAPFQIEKSRFDIVSRVSDFISQQNSLKQQHVLKFKTSHTNLEITSDPNGLEQILLNLTQNARRHHTSDTPIIISLEGENGKISIGVENEGDNILNADKHKIFTPFYTTSNTGTGLGLPTSRKIAKALDGDLYFDTVNQKTRFILDLPRN